MAGNIEENYIIILTKSGECPQNLGGCCAGLHTVATHMRPRKEGMPLSSPTV